MKWPTLISCCSATIGVSLTFIAVGLCFDPVAAGNWWSLDRILRAGLDATAVMFLSLSYFLWSARDWARRTLVVVCLAFALVLGGAMLPMLFGGFAGEHRFAVALGACGLVLGVLAVPVFCVFVLSHPDVAAGFRCRGESI